MFVKASTLRKAKLISILAKNPAERRHRCFSFRCRRKTQGNNFRENPLIRYGLKTNPHSTSGRIYPWVPQVEDDERYYYANRSNLGVCKDYSRFKGTAHY